jgi:flagellar biosynthesis protein FlhF
MSVKKFTAATMQQAMKAVSEQLGPEALILSTKRSDHGVEVLAKTEASPAELSLKRDAAPRQVSMPKSQNKAEASPRPRKAQLLSKPSKTLPDDNLVELLQSAREGKKDEVARELEVRKQRLANETAAVSTSEFVPQDNEHEELEFLRKEVTSLRRWFEQEQDAKISGVPKNSDFELELRELGFSRKLSENFSERYSHMEAEDAWILTRTRLAESLTSQAIDIVSTGGVYAFVGPTGAGKTTSLSKLATLFTLRYGAEQLAIISTDQQRIGAHDTLQALSRILGCSLFRLQDLDTEAQQKLSQKSLILIDTNGSAHNHKQVLSEISEQSWGGMLKSLIVLPANISQYGMDQASKQFSAWNPVSGVLTKVDECPVAGGVVSHFMEQKLSLSYWTNGPAIPEDIVRADIGRLMETMQAASKMDMQEAV